MRDFQAALCFVFVVVCVAQDYSGRKRGMVGGLGGGLLAMQGGGVLGMKDPVIGSTVLGRPLRGGDVLPDGTVLPRHGGVRDPSGLLNGWGSDFNVPFIGDDWVDPLDGMAWPEQYNGEPLRRVGDQWVIQHNAAKAGAAMGGALVGGVMPGVGGSNVVHGVNKAGMSGLPAIGASPVSAQSGHGLAKAAIGQAASTVDMMTGGAVSMGEPMANQIAANQAMESLQVAKNTVHMSRKDNAMGGAGMTGGVPMVGGVGGPIMAGRPMVDPIGHNIAKSTGTHIGLSSLGTSVGTVGVDPIGAIQHNIGKATLGADQMIGHNIAKASSVPVGHGIMNGGVVGGAMPAVGGVMPGVGGVMPGVVGGVMPRVGGVMPGVVGVMPGVVGPAMVGGMGTPIIGRRTNIVHETNKAGMSGIPAMGHSPIAATGGHRVAKQAVGQAAHIVDKQTGGAVSFGDPLANQVAANLAQETMHVGRDTVNQASAMTSMQNGGMPIGSAMIGGPIGGVPMVGQPMIGNPMLGGGMVKPKKVVKPFTGYKGRSRF